MSNLENLTDKILNEAQARGQALIKEAKAYEENLLKRKTKEANDAKEKMLEKAAFDSNLLKERIISNAEVNSRNNVLNGKQKVIEKTFNMAKEKLNNLPKEDYIDFLSRTIKSLSLKGTEELVVKEEYREAVKGLNLPYKVLDESVDTGFMIKDGKVAMNYNFNDLVDFYREDLVKDVAQALFEE